MYPNLENGLLLMPTCHMATIAVLGTLDTKGEEHGFVAELIRARGHQTILIDAGSLRAPSVKPDISREEIARAAGVDLAELTARQDRGECVAAMAKGAPMILSRLASERRIDGVISLGGGGGTAIATSAMRALPIGFPKIMVSTMASGNTSPYVGVKDIVMMPSVVDVAGLNRLSRQILTRAAGAICGMVEMVPKPGADKPLIVASQFGNTTPCIEHARHLLEKEGYEVVIFAAVGTGGRTMESLVESGLVTGVLDVTTTEWADELVGGVLGAGPTRLDAAAKHGVPAIVTPGCLDMVNFGPPETIPPQFKGRLFYQHNPQVTLMRTTPEENRRLGEIIAEKLNASTAPVSVLIPMRGISVISAPGKPFHDAEADAQLFTTLKAKLRRDIVVREVDCNINDPMFAEACVAELLKNIAATKPVSA
jgi:uncharacterized protein (UPF0261 family)